MKSFFKFFSIICIGVVTLFLSQPAYSDIEQQQTFDPDAVYENEKFKEKAPGVGIGQKIPHLLNIPDNRGRIRHFNELRGRNGMVLFFIRSAVWCPYCIFQLRNISERGAIVEDSGYNIVVLSYDSIRKLSIFAKEQNFPYPLLSDKGSVVIQSFGLLNDNYQPGTTYYGVPYPAAFIINDEGLILHKFYSSEPKDRPTMQEIADILGRLGKFEPIIQYDEDFD